MFSLLSRSRSKLNKSDVQLPAKPDAEPVASQEAQSTSPVTETATGAATDPVIALAPVEAPLKPQLDDGRPSASIYSSDDRQDAQTEDVPASSAVDVSSATPSQVSQEKKAELEVGPASTLGAPANARRFSFRPLSFKFLNGQSVLEEHAKPVLSAEQEHKKKLQAVEDRAKRVVRVSSADKKAKESAVIVRALIVGPTGITLPSAKAKPISKPKVEKVKSQLLKPKTANRVIAQLRALPASTEPLSLTLADHDVTLGSAAPIHAVCLRITDSEAEAHHFSKLKRASVQGESVERTISISSAAAGVASVYNASIAQLGTVFDEMEVVNLVTAPNMGLGAPGDAPGLFSGAVPTAKTIIDGVEQITPQLLALGYATGRVLLPDHTGIHPPN